MTINYKFLCVVLPAFLLFLQGCSVGKNFKRPELELPQGYRNAPASTDTVSVADLPWKEFFPDEELQRLIDAALTRNYDLRIALKNIESSAQLLKQSNAAFAPDIDLFIGASSNIPSGNSLNGISLNQFLNTNHIEDFTVSAGLSWEIDIWGKIRRQQESARAELQQSVETVNAVRTKIVADVSFGYYNLLMLDAQLQTAKENVALNDTILRVTMALKEAGSTTALAVQLVEAQRLSAALLVPQLETRIALQENALRMLAGEFPDVVVRKIRLGDVTFVADMDAGLPVSMVSRRPDVKAAELRLRAANARVGMTQASMYPTLMINLNAGLNSFTAGNWFNIPGSIFGTFASGITQPLFKRRQLKTQFELAKAERDRSELEFRKSVLLAAGEVSDALVKIGKLDEQQVITAQKLATLRVAVSNSRLLFQNGMADYLEVIAAQGSYLQAELEAASVKASSYMAKVELYRALGGGWK